MRLYSRDGSATVHHPDLVSDDNPDGTIEADEHGAFTLPEWLGRMLHGMHVAGRKTWEDDAERAVRLAEAEAERRKDPATLLDAVERLAARIDQPVGNRADGVPGVTIEQGADPGGQSVPPTLPLPADRDLPETERQPGGDLDVLVGDLEPAPDTGSGSVGKKAPAKKTTAKSKSS